MMRIHRSTVVAVLASAAVAGVGVGVAAHRLSGPEGTPAAVSTIRAMPKAAMTSTTPSPATTRSTTTTPNTANPGSTPVPSATPTPSLRRALSEANLLVANDYLDAGYPTVRVDTGSGSGQAAIHPCQKDSPEQAKDFSGMFSGTGISTDQTLYGQEWAMEFSSLIGGQNMVNTVHNWRIVCDRAEELGFTVTSSKPQQVRLPGTGEGHYWRSVFVQDGRNSTYFVCVARTGTRVSVVVVTGKASLVEDLDAELLVKVAALRLG